MISPGLNRYRTFSRGTWNPLLTPYFGRKQIDADTTFNPCPEDNPNLAIEVTSFNGYVRNAGIDLTWETVLEINNQNFEDSEK
jgi:hypothetical protein